MTTPQSPTPSQPGPPPDGAGAQPQQPGQPSAPAPGPGRDAATTILSVRQPPQGAPQQQAAPPQAPPPPGAPPQAPPPGAPPQGAAPQAAPGQGTPPQGAPVPGAQPQTPPQGVPPQGATGGASGQGAPSAAAEPGPGYRSQLPVRRTHLGHAIAAEWTKIRSVRSTYWSLGVMSVLTIGITLLCALLAKSEDKAPFPVLTWTFFGMLLAQLAIVTLGVLVITSEYSTGLIRTTLTVSPRRTRVLTAKVIVFFLVSFTATMVTTGLCGAFLAGMLEGKPPAFSVEDVPDGTVQDGGVYATSEEWLSTTVGVSLYVSLLGLLSLGVGTLLRSGPGAITTMIGLVLVPFIVSAFLYAEAVRELGEKLREFSFINALAAQYGLSFDSGSGFADSGWPMLGLLAGVTTAVLAAAYARIVTRDV